MYVYYGHGDSLGLAKVLNKNCLGGILWFYTIAVLIGSATLDVYDITHHSTSAINVLTDAHRQAYS